MYGSKYIIRACYITTIATSRKSAQCLIPASISFPLFPNNHKKLSVTQKCL